MTEEIKKELEALLANLGASNVDIVVNKIEALIDSKLADLMDQLSDRIERSRA